MDHQCLLQVGAALGQPQADPRGRQAAPAGEAEEKPLPMMPYWMTADSTLGQQPRGLPDGAEPPDFVRRPSTWVPVGPDGLDPGPTQVNESTTGVLRPRTPPQQTTEALDQHQPGLQEWVQITGLEQKLTTALREIRHLHDEKSDLDRRAHDLAQALDREHSEVFELQVSLVESKQRENATEKKLAAAHEEQRHLEGKVFSLQLRLVESKQRNNATEQKLAAALEEQRRLEDKAAALGRLKNESDARHKEDVKENAQLVAEKTGAESILRRQLEQAGQKLAQRERQLSAQARALNQSSLALHLAKQNEMHAKAMLKSVSEEKSASDMELKLAKQTEVAFKAMFRKASAETLASDTKLKLALDEMVALDESAIEAATYKTRLRREKARLQHQLSDIVGDGTGRVANIDAAQKLLNITAKLDRKLAFLRGFQAPRN